jgi:V/A-type H+-transporting ATPase subunit A
MSDRTRGIALLAEADRLAPMLELIGLQALPAKERMVVLAGRLLRDAVLQQSALSKNDATCTPEKQTALLEMVLDVYDRCIDLVGRGVAVASIEGTDLSGLSRVRDEVGSDDAEGVRRRTVEVLTALEALA